MLAAANQLFKSAAKLKSERKWFDICTASTTKAKAFRLI